MKTKETGNQKCPYCYEDLPTFETFLDASSCCVKAYEKFWQNYFASVMKQGIKVAVDIGMAGQMKEVFPSWFSDFDEEE
jgi:hypothetical protein